MNRHKHAIIIIKNDKNEYLQYYDKNWKSYLFLNCKLLGDFKEQDIAKEVTQRLKLSNNNLKCKYLEDKIHKKYSVSAEKEKEYHHYFYSIEIENMPIFMNEKVFTLDSIKYSWYSLEELENDSRIQEVNSDIVGFIKEMDQ